MNHYKQLDGLRAIAIILVMIAHWSQNNINIAFFRNIPFASGVTLFFVISGFLITKILLDFKEKNRQNGVGQFKSIKSFFIRRTLRIFPIYYLTIFFLFFIDYGETAKLFPWLLTYSSNILMAKDSIYLGSFTHFWSLGVEEQFYLFWVFIIVFISREYLKKTIIFFIVFSILILYYLWYYEGLWLSNSLVFCNMYSLGLGALLAYYVKYKSDVINSLKLSRLKLLLLCGFLIYTMIYIYRKPNTNTLYDILKDYRDPAISIIYAITVLIAVKDGFNGLIGRFLENKVILYIGRISYGLYVYHLFMHPFFMNYLNKYLNIQTNNFGIFIILLTLNLTIATLSWYLIEKPINSLKKYFSY